MRSPQGPDFPNNGSIRVGEGRWLENQNPRKGRNALNLSLHLPLCGRSIKHRVNAHALCITGYRQLYFCCIDKLINWRKLPQSTYSRLSQNFRQAEKNEIKKWTTRNFLICNFFLLNFSRKFENYFHPFYYRNSYGKISTFKYEVRKLENSARVFPIIIRNEARAQKILLTTMHTCTIFTTGSGMSKL